MTMRVATESTGRPGDRAVLATTAAHQDIPKKGVRNCNTLDIPEDFGRGLAPGSRSAILPR
jgi:hypothetical protein